MKLFQRFTALFLAVMLLAVQLPVSASAAETLPITVTATHINPLYADSVTEKELNTAAISPIQADATPEYVNTVEEAGKLLREQMVERAGNAYIYVYADNLNTGDDFKVLCAEILEAAFAHTGEPTEGDYLRWHYAGAKLSGSYHTDIKAVDIIFTLTYHTTADQEAEMDDAVAELLSWLNLKDMSDYAKIKAIYDYICANVTYDFTSEGTLKHTAYAALINRTAVCQGYASLLYRLLLEENIDTRLIAGKSRDDDHGWNIVELDDLYYNVDATWDAGNTTYAYFLRSMANFADHERSEEYNTTTFNNAYPMAASDYADPNHEHIYTESKTAPTCTEQGYTTLTCITCTHSKNMEFIDALGHSWDEGIVTKEPTKTETGVITYTCTACEETRTEELPYKAIIRISGANRVSTALAVATELKEVLGVDTFDTIIIAAGGTSKDTRKFADALSGSYLASVKKAPILLYTSGNLAEENLEFIKDNLNKNGTIYLLGGEAAVPASVADAVEGYKVERLYGNDRYATNRAILNEVGLDDAEEILIATGENFADSLSASATGLPIMLVKSSATALDAQQIEFLNGLKGKKFTILGGTAAVSAELEAAIEALIGADVVRISGATREETSVKIAQTYFANARMALIAYSRNYPDGLAGGVLANALGAPLLLTNAGKETVSNSYIKGAKIENGYVLGGTAAITDATAKAVFGLDADAAIETK